MLCIFTVRIIAYDYRERYSSKLIVLVFETETDLIVTSIHGIMFYSYSLSFYMCGEGHVSPPPTETLHAGGGGGRGG